MSHDEAAHNLGNSLGNCSFAYKVKIGFPVLISYRNPIVISWEHFVQVWDNFTLSTIDAPMRIYTSMYVCIFIDHILDI